MWKIIFLLNCILNCIIGYKITQISTPKLRLAGYPAWDPMSQSVLFVEFSSGGKKRFIHRYSYQDNAFYSASASPALKSCSFIYPTNRRNFYVISNLHDANLMHWDGISQQADIVRKIVTVDPNNLDNYIVCGTADAFGRFHVATYSSKLCGTIDSTQSIYQYTVDGDLKRLASGFYGTTGLIFSADGSKAYHLDNCALKINGFDVDSRTGNLYNRRVVFDFRSFGKTLSTCTPLTLALDSNGLLYTLDFRQTIYQINPRTKRVVQTIDTGISGISGLTFGGPKLDILFVTASSIIISSLTGQVIQNVTCGSSLYAITGLSATGVKVSSIDLSTLVPLNNNC